MLYQANALKEFHLHLVRCGYTGGIVLLITTRYKLNLIIFGGISASSMGFVHYLIGLSLLNTYQETALCLFLISTTFGFASFGMNAVLETYLVPPEEAKRLHNGYFSKAFITACWMAYISGVLLILVQVSWASAGTFFLGGLLSLLIGLNYTCKLEKRLSKE